MTNETSGRDIRRRSSAWAGILSFITVGLGHIYVGRIAKGLVLFGVSFFCSALGAFALFPFGTAVRLTCLVLLGVSAAVWVYAIIDARRLARSAPADYRLKDYNRWYIYVLLVSLQIPVGIGFGMYVRAGIVAAFQIASSGMAPTIRRGERVLANKLAYQSAPVRRGDIVVLINPNNRGEKNIKRVVGLPGDRVEVRAGEVVLNGRRIDTPFPTTQGSGAGADSENRLTESLGGRTYPIAVPPASPGGSASMPEIIILNGHCLVLNDDRADVYDSRRYGLVPLRDIIGRIDYIYWPRWALVNR
jgi:signal peptidase I